jgi:hypothetical protein
MAHPKSDVNNATLEDKSKFSDCALASCNMGPFKAILPSVPYIPYDDIEVMDVVGSELEWY